MIDVKYCSRDLAVLTPDEIVREAQVPKKAFSLELFQDDLDFAKEHNLNISRIIRIKFHEWLAEKKGE